MVGPHVQSGTGSRRSRSAPNVESITSFLAPIKLSARRSASCSSERHRLLNRARINDSLLTALENENVTAPRASIGALSSAEFLPQRDRKSTRLNSSHITISYAVFCLKK